MVLTLKQLNLVLTIIGETTVSTKVSGIKHSITVVPAIFVRTVGSTRLAGASVIILFHVKTWRVEYHNFRDLHYLL